MPPSDGSREDAVPPEPSRVPPADDCASQDSSRDPWARGDPWQSPLRESDTDEYARFLAWKRSQGSDGYGGRPPWNAHWTQSTGGWGAPWSGGGEDYERTTAGPPPEWDGVSIEFKDWKLKALFGLGPQELHLQHVDLSYLSH